MSRCQQNSPPFYRYLPMLRYHRWKSLTAEDFTPRFFQDHTTTGKKATALYRRWRNSPCPYWKGTGGNAHLSPRLREYLYKLIALCRKKDVPLVFVVTPYETKRGRVRRVPPRASARKNGVPVLDYNTPGGRDIGFDYATDLADHAHVNTAGAQKSSTDLAAYLAEHYGMPGQAWRRGLRGVGTRRQGMEHRDAQNITLRFTLDMAEYFRLLMRIRTWQRSSRHRATPRKRIPPLRAQCSGNGAGHAAAGTKRHAGPICGGRRKKSCTRRPAPARWNTRFPGAGTM